MMNIHLPLMCNLCTKTLNSLTAWNLIYLSPCPPFCLLKTYPGITTWVSVEFILGISWPQPPNNIPEPSYGEWSVNSLSWCMWPMVFEAFAENKQKGACQNEVFTWIYSGYPSSFCSNCQHCHPQIPHNCYSHARPKKPHRALIRFACTINIKNIKI